MATKSKKGKINYVGRGARSKQEAQKWVDGMKEYVLEEIEKMRRDTAALLKKTDVTVSRNTQKAASLLGAMEKSVGDVVNPTPATHGKGPRWTAGDSRRSRRCGATRRRC